MIAANLSSMKHIISSSCGKFHRWLWFWNIMFSIVALQIYGKEKQWDFSLNEFLNGDYISDKEIIQLPINGLKRRP